MFFVLKVLSTTDFLSLQKVIPTCKPTPTENVLFAPNRNGTGIATKKLCIGVLALAIMG
jgi:hypothetical protein